MYCLDFDIVKMSIVELFVELFARMSKWMFDLVAQAAMSGFPRTVVRLSHADAKIHTIRAVFEKLSRY